MLSYTSGQTLFQTLTNNTSIANQTFGATMMNEGIRLMLGDLPWPFLETSTTELTVAGTQSYTLPGDLDQLINVYILVGTYKYSPDPVTSANDWAMLNNPTGTQSDVVSKYFIAGNTIQFWPTPAASGNTITYDYVQATKDISVADHTSGTITTATNGSTAIVGSGTSWNAGMIGKWLRIASSNVANVGDGLWYKIGTVPTATTLTLNAAYKGVSIVGGTASHIISDCSLIPESYQLGPVYYAAAEYWRKTGQESKADRFEEKFNELSTRLKRAKGTKTSSVVVDDNTDNITVNPNLTKSAT